MTYGTIAGIEYFLPSGVVSNADLATAFSSSSVDKTAEKTGIYERRIASEDECASDLAVAAAQKLFKSGICSARDIDFILLCTQSPDYMIPTTACILQNRLGISTATGALDFNLGCSGFVYGLGLAEGLVRSGQAKSILLITAETYSKYLAKTDKASRLIFGDGAAATLIRAKKLKRERIGPFVFGTDGRGSSALILLGSGSRKHHDGIGYLRGDRTAQNDEGFLFMEGNRVFQFVISVVPASIQALLSKSELRIEDVDLFVFHQANGYLIEEVRKTLQIPREKLQITLRHCGNTVSSTIPIALKHAQYDGRLQRGTVVVVAGFGVGFSWAATVVKWY